MRQHIAWDLGEDPAKERAQKADSEIRISDMLGFAALPFAVVSVPFLGVPLNETVAVALVGLSLLRPTAPGARIPAWLVLPLSGLWTVLFVSAQLNAVDGSRRLVHMLAFIGLALILAGGRVSPRSAGTGLALGLSAVTGLAILGIGGDYYPGRLTGFFGDPNAAAFYLAALGALAFGFAQDRVRRIALFVVPLGLVLTESRTGLLALAFGFLWYFAGRRLGLSGGLLAVGALVYTVTHIPESVKNWGPFAGRSGSDLLRERILAKEREMLADAPWYGSGPGTARVELREGMEFFFHNSYLSVRQEGGYPALVLILAALTFAFIGLGAAARKGDRFSITAQLSVIGVVVMATTLGEVLFELPTAVVLGFAARTAMTPGLLHVHREPPP